VARLPSRASLGACPRALARRKAHTHDDGLCLGVVESGSARDGLLSVDAAAVAHHTRGVSSFGANPRVNASPSIPPSTWAALTEAAAVISSTLDLRSVLDGVARLACDVVRSEASCLFTLDGSKGKLVVLAASGKWREALPGHEFDADVGIPGRVVRTAAPMIVNDVRTCVSFDKRLDDLGSIRTRSILATPMLQRGDVVGVIEVANRRDDALFTETDLKVLQLFATLATSACLNARAHESLKEQLAGFREAVLSRDVILGESQAWKRVLELCDRVAPSSATALLLGETGTGKELAARYIHNGSRRREGTFVPVNCAAVPETLLETELFGHEKGAFTGAHARRRGWFEVAEGGTLFLDEIGEVGRPMQAKLLRVLQEKRIVRVGGTSPIACDVRVVAATNRNLKNMVIDGLFREDLYYRLNVFPIHLPALRERREDIPLFVQHYVERARRACGIRELHTAVDTLRILTHYNWPGNVRELQNVIERAVLMSDGEHLLPCHLPPDIVTSDHEAYTDQTVGTLFGQERTLIQEALKTHNWNQSKAAEALGITRYHVRHRIKKYGIQKPV